LGRPAGHETSAISDLAREHETPPKREPGTAAILRKAGAFGTANRPPSRGFAGRRGPPYTPRRNGRGSPCRRDGPRHGAAGSTRPPTVRARSPELHVRAPLRRVVAEDHEQRRPL